MAKTTHTPFTHYLFVWLGLLALTVLSFLLSRAHLGAIDAVLALSIAVAKSLLVVLFFMHLLEERFTVVIVPILAVGYVVLLVALMVTDVATRRTFPRAPLPASDPAEGPTPAAGADEQAPL